MTKLLNVSIYKYVLTPKLIDTAYLTPNKMFLIPKNFWYYCDDSFLKRFKEV